MWQINKYTNIRYHIYKELSKYRKLQEKHGSNRINEIAVPILTGILVILVTNRLAQQFSRINIYCFLGILISAFIGYVVLLILLKRFFYYYEYKIKPNRYPIKTIKPDDKYYFSRQEEDAAKFNYEVMYLVESAYNQATKIDVHDKLLLRISLLNILFCIKNALRKISESLLGYSEGIDRGLVSDSRIKVALESIIATIKKLQSYDTGKTCLYRDEIEFVKGLYNDIRIQIELKYKITIEESVTQCSC